MNYSVLNPNKLAEMYTDLGWVVWCDADTQKAHTAPVEDEE